MDEILRDAMPDAPREPLSHVVQLRRKRAHELLTAKQDRLKSLEAELQSRLEDVGRQLAEQDTAAGVQQGELQAREAVLAERITALAGQQKSLADQEQEWQETRRAAIEREEALLAGVQNRLAELGNRQQLLEIADRDVQARTAALDRSEAELAHARAAHEQQAAELARQQQSLADCEAALKDERHEHEAQVRAHQEHLADVRRQQHELDARRQVVADRERETQRQRRQVAQQLRARKQELTAEVELHRAEMLASASGQELQLQMRLSELQGKYEKLRDELVHRDQAKLDAARQLTDLQRQLSARQQELAQQHAATEQAEAQKWQLQAELDRARKELDAARVVKPADPAEAEELVRLRAENKQLEKRLAQAEADAKTSQASDSESQSQEFDDLRRRFEMALSDLRELKTKNADLCDQLAKAKRTPTAPLAAGNPGGGPLDWEAQKRRLLEQLESDFDQSDEQAQKDKLTVQGAIKITDEMVAERDQEIRELRQLLQNQSQNVGDVAVGASAIAQMFDSDELLTQEREAARQLQETLREQLKKAEVDISLERAKLARERSELDEKLRQWEAQVASQPLVIDASSGKGKGAQPRGKWLARLGLGEGKDG